MNVFSVLTFFSRVSYEMCQVLHVLGVFLVRLQGKFEIDLSWSKLLRVEISGEQWEGTRAAHLTIFTKKFHNSYTTAPET